MPFPSYRPTITTLANGQINTVSEYLDRFVRQPALDTTMQARFAFRDKRELRVSILCIRNKPSHDSRLAHHILLLALPAIGMCEDKVRP